MRIIPLPTVLSALLFPLALSACMQATPAESQWRPVARIDQFTDATSCRVERGTELWRMAERRATRTYLTAEFFVENRDGALRLGAVMEPTAPMAGELQIRVDNNPPWTITLAETPLDSQPDIPTMGAGTVNPQAEAAMADVQGYALKFASPYRITQGDKARQILDQILAGHTVKYRLQGINAAATTTGQFEVDAAFRDAVTKCGLSG